MTDLQLNGPRLARARARLDRTQRAAARAAGVTNVVQRSLETGVVDPTMPVGTLAAVAEAAGLSLADLFAVDPPAATAEGNDDRDDVEADAGLLARVLVDDRRLVQTSAVAAALGWSMGRTNRAANRLTARLEPSGLRVYRLDGKLGLRPLDGAADPGLEQLRRRAQRRQGYNTGAVGLIHGALHGTATTQGVPHAIRPWQLALGTLGP